MTANVQATTPELLSLRQAERLGHGKYSTLRKRISQGELPAVRLGARGDFRVRTSDLEALLTPVSGAASEATVNAAIERLVAAAPTLTDEQIHRLSGVFGGGSR